MNSELEKAQKMARSKIESGWKEIADNYTVGWAGPLEVVEMQFPHVSSAISGIRNQVSPTLPLIIYQTRQSPPEKMSIAVPYQSGGDPYKCRLVATDELSSERRGLLGEFAQAIWFLIDSRVLPDPRTGNAFEDTLVEWTGAELIRL